MRDTLIAFIEVVGNVISLLIIARSLLSFFPVDRSQFLVKLVYDLTEPMLAPFATCCPNGRASISAHGGDFANYFAGAPAHLVVRALF